MLFDNGITSRLGKVEDGNTVSDFGQEEQKRQISINTRLSPWSARADGSSSSTPPDSRTVGEVGPAVQVADSLLIAVSGISGIEVRRTRPRRPEASSKFRQPSHISSSTVKTPISARSSTTSGPTTATRPCRFSCPWAPRPPSGVMDLLGNKAYMYETNGGGRIHRGRHSRRADGQELAQAGILVEAIVEADDELMMRYLDGETISVEELLPALRKAIVSRTVLPVFPVLPPERGRAPDPRLHRRFLPFPTSNPGNARPEDGKASRISRSGRTVLRHLLQGHGWPYVGKLSFIRVNSRTPHVRQHHFQREQGEENGSAPSSS